MVSQKSTATIVAGPPDPKLDSAVSSGFGLGLQLTSANYEVLNIQLDRDVQNILGIQLTDSCIVHGVNRENVDVLFGDLWLELNGVPIKDKKHFSSMYRKMSKRVDQQFILNLKIARLICQHKSREEDMKRLPIDISPSGNFKYHKALVYGIPGLRLTLGLKAINNKVYVASVQEETLGKMSFSVGDSILDVDSHVVFTINDTYEYLKKQLKSNLLATCLVERADAEDAKYQVREALRSEKNPTKIERMSKDVEKICRREKRKNLRTPDPVVPRGILRIGKPTNTAHVQLIETPFIVTIAADIHPKLLKSVPAKNLLPEDTPLAPGKTAEAIISEISSEQISSVKSSAFSSENTGKKVLSKDKMRENKKTDEKRTKEDTTQDTANTNTTKTTRTGSAEEDKNSAKKKSGKTKKTVTTTVSMEREF